MKTGFRLIGAFSFSAFVLLSNLPGNARAQDIATIQLRAEKGDAQSQTQLGYRYSAGEGVAQDFPDAKQASFEFGLPLTAEVRAKVREEVKGWKPSKQ